MPVFVGVLLRHLGLPFEIAFVPYKDFYPSHLDNRHLFDFPFPTVIIESDPSRQVKVTSDKDDVSENLEENEVLKIS